MLVNSDCTIYSRKPVENLSEFQWEEQYVKECWWFEEIKSSVTTEGLKSADVLKVRIPDLTISVKKDDIILKGNCPVEMRTVKDLEGYKYFKVVTANYNSFGDEPHIKVVGV